VNGVYGLQIEMTAVNTHSTPSPFLAWLSQRAQSFGKWVWFIESNIVLAISFYLLFYLLTLFLKQKWRAASS
jgi:hypothetical protein